MPFIPAFLPPAGPAETDIWFIFRGDSLLVKTADAGAAMPLSKDVSMLQQNFPVTYYVGTLGQTPCYAAEMDARAGAPAGMSFQELRWLLGLLDEEHFSVAGRAFQILRWERNHKFCGSCGSPTIPKAGERAKECPQCGLIIYPELSPAIIVAVMRGKEILLAHSSHFQAKFYSVLAGFVELGETFEGAVQREVKEEVGIEINNIRYVGSQPWPFPNSLMIGFTADYSGGELAVDEAEITDAAWFSADNLPAIPRPGTIARRLIDLFIEKSKH